MKLMSFFMFVCCLQLAARSDGQTVTLTANNERVIDVLKKIQEQTGYNIIAEQSLLNKRERVNVTLKNVTVKDALALSLKGLSIDFNINGRTIVLKKGKPIATSDNLSSPITGISIIVATVSGKVTDIEGVPLSKVSVYNSTTRKGTVSAQDGTFSIEASEGHQLSFSYIGYKTLLYKVTSKTSIQIEMEIIEKDLEEFVATGYQSIRKKSMTGSVAKVKAEDLLINGTNTIEQMIQGKLAGVDVVNNSGQIGTRQTVRVRGVSTLLGNQEPVWVVDGIIQEDPLPFQAKELNAFNQEPSNSELLKNFIGSTISWLNPYDIEDITVLKDAASTAIYGVKAANGVILINTKRGKAGRSPVVNYSTSISTQSKVTYDKLNLMNSKERVDVSREIWERGLTSYNTLDRVGYSGLLRQYLEEKMSYDEFNKGVKQLEVNNTNWLDILFQQPFNQSHAISVSGGSTNNSYYGSVGTNLQKGTAKGNAQNSYQGSLNFTSNITPRLIVSAKIAGSYAKTNGFFNINPYQYATTTSRVIPAYNPDGSLSYYLKPTGGYFYNYNVINELEESGNSNVRTSLNSNFSVRYRFLKGFSFESLFGINYANISSEGYATERSYAMTAVRMYEYAAYGPSDAQYQQSKLPYGGMLTTMSNNNYNYTWRNSISYGQTFNKRHSVTGMVGMELRSNIYKATNATVYGYMPDRGKAIMAPPATVLSTSTSGGQVANLLYTAGLINTSITDRLSNYISYFGTGAYTYDNRYVLSASIRTDASNRFGQDARSRFKPIVSVGGRWNVANEKFFQKSEWLNNLSLRASYGFQGNVAENFGPDLIVRIPSGNAVISNLTGEAVYQVSNLPYSNLRWERTQTVNLGLDLDLFKGRIGAVIDYYSKRSKDLIIMKDVPFENGVIQMPVNGGDLYNKGLDVTVTLVPVRTKNFTWNFGINMARNYNKVTSRQVQNPTWGAAKSGTYYKEGYAVSSFWVFDFIGLDSATGVPLFNIPTAANDPAAKFDAAAFMKYAGKLNADFTGGFNTSIRYKTFTLSSSMYLSLGGYKILAPLYTIDMIASTPYEYNNLSKDLVTRWRKPGDNAVTDIPSLPQTTIGFITIPSGALTFGGLSQGSTERPYTLYNFSTARVVNASFFRINNINLNYTLPAHIAKYIFSKTATVGYSISNLHTFVSKDYKGVDPEVASGSQPLPRVHAINLSITF